MISVQMKIEYGFMGAGVHIRHNYIFIPRLASDSPFRMTAYVNDVDGGG